MQRYRESTFVDEPADGLDDNPDIGGGMEGRTIELTPASEDWHGHSRDGIPNDSLSWGASTIGTNEAGQDATRLYAICDRMLQQQGANRAERTSFTASMTCSDAWDAVREWLAAHPMPGDRAVAASYQGQFNTTALHLLCKLQSPPSDIVRDLIQCAPHTAAWADSNDCLPLHHACYFGASLRVLSLLVNAHPHAKVAQDKRKRTPLHFTFGVSHTQVSSDADANHDNAHPDPNDSYNIVRLLSDSGAATLSDETGNLPIHYACAYGTSAAALQVLVDAYPAGISAKEHGGRTPLHLAMANAHRPASVSVLGFLLSIPAADIINTPDNSGALPLHLLATSTRLPPENVKERHMTAQCLRIYLAAEPLPSADFLTALQSLPSWLGDQAVVTPYVQTVLNDRIIRRFHTFFLLLDGYSIILLITFFTIATHKYIQNGFNRLQDDIKFMASIVLIFFFCVYFALREITQMISLANLHTFSSWFKDGKNLLDVVVISFAVVLGSIMASDLQIDNQSFRSAVAFAQGFFWASFIVWLKSLRIEFAVFLRGVLHIIRRLQYFLVALFFFLFGFAEMFLILYYRDDVCDELQQGEANLAVHCQRSTSLTRVTRMMLGAVEEAWVTYGKNNTALVFFGLYVFFVVLVLSNVLIVLVIDSYGVIQNERAAVVFWSDRLDFVTEMDAILRILEQTASCLGLGTWEAPTNPSSSSSSSQPKKPSPFGHAWDTLTSVWYTKDSDDGVLFFFFFRIATAFIIPIWLLLGVVTAGILWPPQIRAKLLVRLHLGNTKSAIAKELTKNVKELRQEVSTLRTELKEEVKNDYKDIMKLQSELNAARTSIMTGIHQMNHMMTVLLDNAREQNRVPELQAARSGEY